MNGDLLRMSHAGPAVAAAGVKHVLLTYHYLDIGDFDGYASLTEKDVTLSHPGSPLRSGREAVLNAQAAQAASPRRHELETVIAAEDTVVVLGRVVGCDQEGADGVDFADVFTLSEQTLVNACRRYYYTPSPCAVPVPPGR
ncbi:nuclear transport factor 2 family protein [Streptomyces sp. NPDC096012]|uniref:nuclear transport factor 2 family protein n=1 Tax=Streptomyces sp. NPDC096012 TaxID=3155684 RepID=UPI00336A3B9F